MRTTEKGKRPHEEETCGKCLKTWSRAAGSNLSRRWPPPGGDGRRNGWWSRSAQEKEQPLFLPDQCTLPGGREPPVWQVPQAFLVREGREGE